MSILDDQMTAVESTIGHHKLVLGHEAYVFYGPYEVAQKIAALWKEDLNRGGEGLGNVPAIDDRESAGVLSWRHGKASA